MDTKGCRKKKELTHVLPCFASKGEREGGEGGEREREGDREGLSERKRQTDRERQTDRHRRIGVIIWKAA